MSYSVSVTPHSLGHYYCLLTLSNDDNDISESCTFNLKFLFEMCHANHRLKVINDCVSKVLYRDVLQEDPKATLPFITEDLVTQCEKIYLSK